MSIAVAIGMLIKALLLTFGILAHNGLKWAYAIFIGLSITTLLFDIILLLVTHSVDKDIERRAGL